MMVTKAIIEEVVSPYRYRVRIPIFDQISSSSTSTAKELLPIASVCGIPGLHYNFKVNDIVYIAVENNERDNIVILGMLLTEETAYKGKCDLVLNDLTVDSAATLPNDTSVGSIKNVVAEFVSVTDTQPQKLIILK